MSRPSVGAALVVGLGTLSACGTAPTYAPKLSPGRTASVELRQKRVPDAAPDARDWSARERTVVVQVFDFADGCPDVKFPIGSHGYRGVVEVPPRSSVIVRVPAGKRIIFDNEWQENMFGGGAAAALADAGVCRGLVSFIPQAGGVYVLDVSVPIRGSWACAIAAGRESDGAEDEGSSGDNDRRDDELRARVREQARANGDLMVHPTRIDGDPAFQPGGLCALAAVAPPVRPATR